jgi:hypothetical protein
MFPIFFKRALISVTHSSTFQVTLAHAVGFSLFTSRLLATELSTETITSYHTLNPYGPTSSIPLLLLFSLTQLKTKLLGNYVAEGQTSTNKQ